MKLGLLITAILFSQMASAGILIEPYAGVSQNTFTGTDSESLGSGDSSGKSAPTIVGGRLGYKFAMFWAALDYNSATGKFKSSASAADEGNLGGEHNMLKSQSWLDVGFDFPIMLRGWVGMGSTNTNIMIDRDAVSGVWSDFTLKGSSTKVGLGFSGIPFMSINVEYVMTSYSKADTSSNFAAIEGKDKDISFYFKEFKDNAINITVSAPFDF